MKLGIVGSRLVRFQECESIILEWIEKLKPAVVVSGGAIGVDSHAVTIAKKLHIKTEIYKPAWYIGKHAAFLRNTTIAEQSDIIIAIYPGSVPTSGTKDTATKAKLMGKRVIEVFLKPFQINLL